MSYPRLVYRCPGNIQRAGGTYEHKPVEDDCEHKAALAGGWFSTLPEAIEGKSVEAQAKEDNAPPNRAELEAKAKELGIKFDGRTNDAKLGKLIADALDS